MKTFGNILFFLFKTIIGRLVGAAIIIFFVFWYISSQNIVHLEVGIEDFKALKTQIEQNTEENVAQLDVIAKIYRCEEVHVTVFGEDYNTGICARSLQIGPGPIIVDLGYTQKYDWIQGVTKFEAYEKNKKVYMEVEAVYMPPQVNGVDIETVPHERNIFVKGYDDKFIYSYADSLVTVYAEQVIQDSSRIKELCMSHIHRFCERMSAVMFPNRDVEITMKFNEQEYVPDGGKFPLIIGMTDSLKSEVIIPVQGKQMLQKGLERAGDLIREGIERNE